jgi:hypothetical protein
MTENTCWEGLDIIFKKTVNPTKRIWIYTTRKCGKTPGLVLVDQIRPVRANQVLWFGLSQPRTISSSGGASWGTFLATYRGGSIQSKQISGVGTIFRLLQVVHILPGPNKQRAFEPSVLWAELGDKIINPAASFVLDIHFKVHILVVRDAHLARSIIENKCLGGLDRILDNLLSVFLPPYDTHRTSASNSLKPPSYGKSKLLLLELNTPWGVFYPSKTTFD